MDSSGRARALVVYESMFGNTEAVARAVARGLQLGGVGAEALEVAAAPAVLRPELDLVVVGAPTHAFALSRPTTRQDAVRQGAPPERADAGLREWLASCRHDRVPPLRLAAFDTRATTVRWLPQSASRSAVRLARKHGFGVTTAPVGFLVDGVQGPLVDGELDSALAWGRQLAAECRQQVGVGTVTDAR